MNSSRLILILLYFVVVAGYSQEKAQLKYYTEKADKYLDKEKSLSAFFSIDKEGIKTFATAKDHESGKPEFFITWDHLEDYKQSFQLLSVSEELDVYKSGTFNAGQTRQTVKKINNPQMPLQGMLIAIDPGHIANDLATGKLEMKHIKFKKDVLNGLMDSVDIAEGMLTYATALLLKDKLEAGGANVILTRPEGLTAFGKTFEQWKKDDLKKNVDSLYKTGEIKASQKQYFLSDKAQDRDIFRVLFRDLDLAKRAEIINNFKPDFTVIIHFNVDETNSEWLHPSKRDFNMTFVGGAFMKNDLSTSEKRFEFLRLLITDDLEKSISLSSSVIAAFEKDINVTITGDGDAKYIGQSCLSTGSKGVYCRNLQLTRYVHSPLVYGETLYQDNIKESQLLNKEKDKTKNERIQQVANAYYEGILDYVNKSY